MTLTEFLLARFDEDEASATAALTREHWHYEGYGDFGPYVSGAGVETEDSDQGQSVARYLERMNPWRALAECEAKRQMLELHKQTRSLYEERNDMTGACASESSGAYFTDGMGPSTRWPCKTVRLLALPYADHPDYQQEWKP